MSDVIFTKTDSEQIIQEGLSVDQALAQINLFKRGPCPVKLNRPCVTNDGIISIPEKDLKTITALYEEETLKGRIMKFVPASGAASRMFKDWFRCLEKGVFDSEEEKEFANNIKKFAFYNDVRSMMSQGGQDIEDMIENKRCIDILAYIITSKGLNYGNLPKALLKFHVYPDINRTALDEHLVEASLHTKDSRRICRIHFTVSEEHQEEVNDHISRIKKYFEQYYDVTYDITLSTQKSSTNTIAAEVSNLPFRDQQGRLVFRPGGHGALLENLNNIDGDIIFLKNIDNVIPDRLKSVTIYYKKILGGYLMALQNEIFKYLRILDEKEPDNGMMAEILLFCGQKLHIIFPKRFYNLPLAEKCAFIFKKLNRPLRVCGMVKNEGEPGGGPFWINEEDGSQSLQIIEESQIDSTSKEQKALWSKATHFNPVDLVCGVRDYKFRKFDLHTFVDKDSYFISQKSEKGRDLKALELPGLWNGSMAFWNTIFVEVPIETFNPVKTVNDLLRPQHLPDS